MFRPLNIFGKTRGTWGTSGHPRHNSVRVAHAHLYQWGVGDNQYAQVLNDYFKVRKDLKPRTLTDYQCVLHEVVPDWLDKPLVNITREMIAKRHTKHGQANSKARANNAMRVAFSSFVLMNNKTEENGSCYTSLWLN